MEIYQPIIIAKGEEKLVTKIKTYKAYNYRINSNIVKLFSKAHHSEEVFDKLTLKNKEPLNPKVV